MLDRTDRRRTFPAAAATQLSVRTAVVRSACGFRALRVRARVSVPAMTEPGIEQRRTDRAYGRDAEHALVAALVLGQADPAELSGRLSGRDFYDPAAGLIFDTVLQAARDRSGPPIEALPELPAMLRAAGELRSDGYPIRPLLDWLPTVSVPAHPQAWSALVVASALGRQVDAAGIRLCQVSMAYRDLPWGGAGRALAMAAAQRATVHAALMRGGTR